MRLQTVQQFLLQTFFNEGKQILLAGKSLVWGFAKCDSHKMLLQHRTGLVTIVYNTIRVQNAEFAFSDMVTLIGQLNSQKTALLRPGQDFTSVKRGPNRGNLRHLCSSS